MNKTTEALKLAEEVLDMVTSCSYGSNTRERVWSYRALAAIRETLVEQAPHPPHRLCECTACLEYWTTLPDCDAFAGGGKPIDHIADTGKMIAEPVKQEPVAWAYIDADGSFMDALDRQYGAYQTPLYAAPVDAKAIRAEALEEVEEIAKTIGGSFSVEFLAAIRGLK